MAAKKPQKVKLFIEGTSDDTNGDLRQGFENLLKKELGAAQKMPKIILGNGVTQTIDKFTYAGDTKSLLIDLDGDFETKSNRLKEFNLSEKNTFFMIQEMEAWFLSQPDILNDFYKTELKIPQKKASEIAQPAKELKRITKNTVRREYHKVSHAVELLGKLKTDRLKNDFPDFKNLIDFLLKI